MGPPALGYRLLWGLRLKKSEPRPVVPLKLFINLGMGQAMVGPEATRLPQSWRTAGFPSSKGSRVIQSPSTSGQGLTLPPGSCPGRPLSIDMRPGRVMRGAR